MDRPSRRNVLSLSTVATLGLALFLVSFMSAPAAHENALPSDLCSLLPPSQLNKVIGSTYDAPTKTVAPRAYMNSVNGTHCTYAKGRPQVDFIVYVENSESVAKENFAKLSMFFGPNKDVTGVGDKAYIDRNHAIHVLKGKVRYFISIDSSDAEKVEKQVKDLATFVAGQI